MTVNHLTIPHLEPQLQKQHTASDSRTTVVQNIGSNGASSIVRISRAAAARRLRAVGLAARSLCARCYWRSSTACRLAVAAAAAADGRVATGEGCGELTDVGWLCDRNGDALDFACGRRVVLCAGETAGAHKIIDVYTYRCRY